MHRGEKDYQLRWVCCLSLALFYVTASGQGTMVYDQQSSTESNFGEAAFDIASNQPMGQSFTPSLDAVRFVRLRVGDGDRFDGFGGSLSLNLRSGSITGTVLATTSAASFTNGFLGTIDFLFSSDVPLLPGTTYFLQPVLQSGSAVLTADSFLYPGGSAFLHGNAIAQDLWFREGVLVPEPSSGVLVLIGFSILAYARKNQVRSS